MNLYHVNIATEWAQQQITQLTVAYPNHDGTEQLREVVKGFVARTELTQTGKLTQTGHFFLWDKKEFQLDFSVGTFEEVMGIDGEGVPTNDITGPFLNSNECPGMNGKLKLFLLQASTTTELLVK